MKNNLFLVICFLLLPFVSYSQVVSHSFEDSTLTVFLKFSSLQIQTDTIYPNGIPNKINFVFEGVDSSNTNNYAIITLVRGVQPIKEHTYDNPKNRISYSYPVSYIVWEEEFFLLEYNRPTKDCVETFFQKIYILPIPIIEGIQREENERIQDSINKVKKHREAVEYYQKRFEKLKEPQENLTEKDKENIKKLSNTITPNSVYLKEKISIDEIEIANIHWLEYMHYMLQDSSQMAYQQAKPDTTIWDSVLDSVDVYLFFYLRYPGFRYYPVVGVSYEQVQQYCIWRGNMVSYYINQKQNKKYEDYETTVHYRLPTKEEWEYAATKDDLNKQFGGYSKKRRYTEKEKRKIYRSAKRYSDSTRTIEKVRLDMKNYFESDTSYKQMFTYKPTYQNPYFDKHLLSYNGQLITTLIYANQPVYHFGLYNMFGNVAEMTSEKGIAKGGSFYHTLEECAADRVQLYDSPKAWLGFRCVVEVVVRKKEGR